MNINKLIINSLKHYKASTIGLLIACTVSAMILAGAMLVGASVHYSLKKQIDYRLGQTDLAVIASQSTFTDNLANSISTDSKNTAVSVLLHTGTVSSNSRVYDVQIIGIDESFFNLAPEKTITTLPSDGECYLNEQSQLSFLESDNNFILRFAKPSMISSEIAPGGSEIKPQPYRLKSVKVLSKNNFSDFNLRAESIPPKNIFVSKKWLQTQTELQNKSNILLLKKTDNKKIKPDLKKYLTLGDYGLTLKEIPDQNIYELTSENVFISDNIINSVTPQIPASYSTLGYFVNSITNKELSCPYSIIVGIGPDIKSSPTSNLGLNEVAVNTWLADDLNASVGDTVSINYYTIQTNGSLLINQTALKVAKIIPIEAMAADQTLMPAFPGLTSFENCSEFEPGVPVDLDKIRDKDETYWDNYRGTPKLFMNLDKAAILFKNRFGSRTSIRIPIDDGSKQQLSSKLLSLLNPKDNGLIFVPVKEMAQTASKGSSDFNGLFIGLSFFLIISTLILQSLIFAFNIEKRISQTGLFSAIGIGPQKIYRIYLGQVFLISLIGSLLGAFFAIIYAKTMLSILANFNSGIIVGPSVEFTPSLIPYINAIIFSIILSLLTAWLKLRKLLKNSSHNLLRNTTSLPVSFTKFHKTRAFSIISLLVIMLPVIYNLALEIQIKYFLLTSLLLIITIYMVHIYLMITKSEPHSPAKKLSTLALRNISLRPSRSLAVFALLSVGIYLVVTIGANKKTVDPETAKLRTSGTGGFRIYSELSTPVTGQLNDQKTKNELILNDKLIKDISYVSMRQKKGDPASCFNLNKPSTPNMLGVDPSQLSKRNAFKFISHSPSAKATGWDMLDSYLGKNIIPVIADYPTLTWSLHKKLGDDITITTTSGQTVNLRIVGVISSSILQGSLILSEENLLSLYPSVLGYNVFLADGNERDWLKASNLISDMLSDYGCTAIPADQKLQEFMLIENSYLILFFALGSFAVILGTVGLGLVVMLNTIERSAEIALMNALGFTKKMIRYTLIFEYLILLVAALINGSILSAIAFYPSIRNYNLSPVKLLVIFNLVLFTSGLLWICLSSLTMIKSSPLKALRNE